MNGDNFSSKDLDAIKAVLQSLNRVTFKELEGPEVIAVSSAFNHLYSVQSKIVAQMKKDQEQLKVPKKRSRKKKNVRV